MNVDHPGADDIFAAIAGVHRRCEGAYAAVAMITGAGLVGFRDPHGIRPLVYGRRASEYGWEHMMASESVALDMLGFEFVADVAPGEAVYVSDQGEIAKRRCAPVATHTPCIFEYVYLARPGLDSRRDFRVQVAAADGRTPGRPHP